MKTDEAFLADLENSRGRVSRFASICRAAGVSIWIAPSVVRETAEDRHDFDDPGDLVVHLRVEHKERGLEFTSAADFPFDTVIVDEVYKIDGIQHRPFWYVSENAAGTRVAVISSRTMDKWKTESKYDQRQGRQCEFYVCPKKLVRFCAIDEVF